MSTRSFIKLMPLLSPWIATLVTSVPARAVQVVVVSASPSGSWVISEGEAITFNGKDKLRVASQDGQINGNAYKQAHPEPILRSGTLRIHADGFMVVKRGGQWLPIAPDGLDAKSAGFSKTTWDATTVTIQKSRKGKDAESLRASDIVCIIPTADTSDSIADFVADENNFRGTGQKNEAESFRQRMTFLVGVSSRITGPASAKLQGVLSEGMQNALNKTSRGLARVSDLDAGLQYVNVSEQAYPSDPAQTKLRDAVRERKDWLNRRLAILRALNAGEEWDAFIDKFGDFERFQGSYADLKKLHENAYRQSAKVHFAEGKRLSEAKQYTPAMEELRFAARRDPGNKQIQTELEKVRLDEAHSFAEMMKRSAPDPTSTSQRQLRRHLASADDDLADGKLADADNEIAAAEAIDKDNPAILLARARLLQTKKDFAHALQTLDAYDRHAFTDEQIQAGESIRRKVDRELKTTQDSIRTQIAKAEEEGDYTKAMFAARQGVALNPEDPEFVYQSGILSMILRRRTESATALRRYLALSQTPGADSERRGAVYEVLRTLEEPASESSGTPNWFSGYHMPSGLFYCPISLMPNIPILHVTASRKQTTQFEWAGGKLRAIHTTTQDGTEPPAHFYFDYVEDNSAVRRVAGEPFHDGSTLNVNGARAIPHLTEKGAVGTGPGVWIALPNNPAVDTQAVQALMGRKTATLVAGNPYFEPFVWTGLHVFIAEYDGQGRLKAAHEINTEKPHELEFRWDGLRLIEVAERSSAGQDSGYKRTISYTGDRVTGETVSARGKAVKIEYKYKGSRLVEASSAENPALDNRARRVAFVE